MPLNTAKIDDGALPLLYLTLHDGCRAWKGMDWDVLGRLHDKGMIDNPVGKVKSVVFTQEGLERAKALVKEMFRKEQARPRRSCCKMAGLSPGHFALPMDARVIQRENALRACPA